MVKFWKSQWGRHFKIAIGIYIIVCFILALIINSLFGLPLLYSFILSPPWIILYSTLIFIGISLTLIFSETITPFFIILLLNDCDYLDKASKIKIPKIVITLPFYLIIFYVFFKSYNNYPPTLLLLISWIPLIFVRSAHYANQDLGHKIGEFIGAFFIPFGFITLVLNINEIIGKSFPDSATIAIFISFFILILLAQLLLEILMSYLTSKKENRRLKLDWKSHPAYVKNK